MARKKTECSDIVYLSDRICSQKKMILQYPCTLVEAPMGYGKTTAVRELLKGENVRVLWQKIFNNSISDFWASFCKQFRELDMVCSKSMEQMGFPSESTSMERALECIQEMLPSSKTVLVLDDYHLVDCPEISQFIEFLLWNELTDFHIVLTARFARSLNIEELLLKGYLQHIEKKLLEFTPTDILSYLRLCGIAVKERDGQRLYAYTEGWVSALYLLMLSYKKEGDFTMPLSITTLIEKTVYQLFSNEIKLFLLHICVFDAFTTEQAAFMWQKGNTQELLDEITQKNAFISFDNKSKIYQNHKIFSEYLRGLFEKREQEENMLLYQRAAAWYLKMGDHIAAMQYSYLAKDFEQILITLEFDQGHSMLNEHREQLIDYFEECPEEIRRKHPIALLIYALCLFSYNEMELFAQICEELHQLLNEGSIEFDTAQELKGEFEMLLSFAQYNNIENMLKHYKRAGELLGNPAKFMDTRGGWTFGSPSVLYMFHREIGKLEEEVELLREAMPCYNRLAKGHGKGADIIMEAERYFMCGNFVDAEITVHKAIYQASESKQEDILLCAIFLLARLALYKGEYSQVLSLFQQLRRDMENENWYNLFCTLDLCEAFLCANLQQKKEIPTWILEGEFLSSRMYFPAMAFFNIVYGRTLLVREDYYKLLGSMDHFIDISLVFPNLLGEIYSRIFAAAANEKLLRREAALEELRKALMIALPDAIYMPFVENCDYVKSLLEMLRSNREYQDAIDTILALYMPYQQSVQQVTKEYFTQKKSKLTERETEIAQLVALGLSNSEIGSRLYISQNTVKTTLKRIFEKLNINSRTMIKRYIDSQI